MTRERGATSMRRITEQPGALDDSRALRAAMLERIRAVVPFDAHGWLLTDPATEVGASPFAEIPSLEELPRLIKLKYLSEVNRWTRLTHKPRTLLGATGGRPDLSLVWDGLLRRYGVVDVASMVFRDQHGCWAFLDLWRVAPAPPFSPGEVAFLGGLVEPVTEALRSCQGRTFLAEPVAAESERGGPTVLVLSPELEVRAQTAAVNAVLERLVPKGGRDHPVSAGAYNVAAQLLAVEAGVDDHPPVARVHLAGATWLTLRASRLDEGGATESGDIAVSIESCRPSERLDLFARASALTRRETELLEHLALGADTHRVAFLMSVSELTVQDHLKSIFAKTGLRSRRELVVRLAGE